MRMVNPILNLTYHTLMGIIAKFNTTSANKNLKILSAFSATTNIASIEIDGVKQQSVVTAYTFAVIGEHTVKYTLIDGVSINERMFESCSGMSSIIIPDNVTSIGGYVFYGCSGLTDVHIGSGATSIGDRAFQLCVNLSSINIPDSVVSIGDNIFTYCDSLPIENDIMYADTYLVRTTDKTLTTYTIKEGTRWIGMSAFRECSGMTSIIIPDTVTEIRQEAFLICPSLTGITIPDSVTYIGTNVFMNCSGLLSAVIGSGITSVPSYVFASCGSLTSVTIPNTVTIIDSYAFSSCSGLTSITIPNSVTTIRYMAFYGCSSLQSIISLATTAPSISNNTFQNVKAGGTLYVPSGSSGYDTWMGSGNYYLGKYGWTKVEQ